MKDLKDFFYPLVFVLLMCNPLCLLSAQPCSASSILSGKLTPQNVRYKTFEKALTLMQERSAKTIVETGAMRGVNLNDIFAGDGGSTILFAEWAKRNGAIVYSVDIDHSAFANSAPFLAQYDNIFTVCADSVEFLSSLGVTIDMLYLDSYDFEVNNPIPSQEHHLKEIIAAYPLLTPYSIVMIDDCGLPYGGKGAMAIEYLLDRGWRIVMQDYQVILTRD